jgi:glycosyltransferase involved in cell wall biosynthesis
MLDPAEPLRVVHVLAAYSAAGAGLWGKERVVESLMVAQRASGAVVPRAITFAPCRLADNLRELGFEVCVLEERPGRLPIRAFAALRGGLANRPPELVHSHGYKANLFTRALRLGGVPMRGLVSTCHAWFDETLATRTYNELDRRTAFLSDVRTVADAGMMAAFASREHLHFVSNGLPDRQVASAETRQRDREAFGFPADRFVIGFLARTNTVKGVLDILAAAARTKGAPVLWVVAGTGELDARVREAQCDNLRFVGYVEETDRYRNAIDGYVQASHVEGLSLSLLEAMRAGLPIVATRAGSTESAVRDGREARLLAIGDVDGLARAAVALADDPRGAAELGNAARARFLDRFGIDEQHRAFLEIYREAEAVRS